MGADTKIEWATHTWNPWVGCQKVSPACDHCYAQGWAIRTGQAELWKGERRRTSEQNWHEPERWDRAAAAAGRIDTVFCLSLGDIWDNDVDPAWRRLAFAVMERTPNLLYLLLSKRIGNAAKMCDPTAGNPLLPRNAALGATIVNQEEADRDIPKLLEAARILEPRFTFLSMEPLLGPVDLDPWLWRPAAVSEMPGYVLNDAPGSDYFRPRGGIGWVIVGGESGPGARPMHPAWARSLRDQCQAAGIAFHFKQHGEWLATADDNGSISYGSHPRHGWAVDTPSEAWAYRVGKRAAGRLLDGRTWDEVPA